MVCCRTTKNHYLKQRCIVTGAVNEFAEIVPDITHNNVFENISENCFIS